MLCVQIPLGHTLVTVSMATPEMASLVMTLMSVVASCRVIWTLLVPTHRDRTGKVHVWAQNVEVYGWKHDFWSLFSSWREGWNRQCHAVQTIDSVTWGVSSSVHVRILAENLVNFECGRNALYTWWRCVTRSELESGAREETGRLNDVKDVSRPGIEPRSQKLASCAITARPPQHDTTSPHFWCASGVLLQYPPP